MKIGIPRETFSGERRVAATPDTVERLRKLGFSVVLEAGAGEAAGLLDPAYVNAGAEVVADADALWDAANIVLKVRPPSAEEMARTRARHVLISLFWPAQNPELLAAAGLSGASVLAMDQVPRISRAQKLDVLSSQANLSGYRAVVEAAGRFGRFFTGQITAAGKVPPAKVLIIGAGVAGLAAVGAARALGAIVRAFDTRPAVREQIQSLGAEFLEVTLEEEGDGAGGYAREMSPAFIEAEMALFLAQAKEVDIIITTALIPGKRAPTLLTEEMVAAMRPGSVIVDLAAEQGGNCALTRPGEAVTVGGVHILGYTDLPSRMAEQASQLFGTNLCHLLHDMGGDADFKLDLSDEVVRAMTIAHDGAVTWPPPPLAAPAPRPAAGPVVAAPAVPPASPTLARPARSVAAPRAKGSSGHGHSSAAKPGNTSWLSLGVAGVVLLAVGLFAPAAFLSQLLVFVLACFIGYQVVWSVTPALHTPLMSVTNAISGIILLGGMVQLGTGGTGGIPSPASLLGGVAILLATINVAGGFLVTQRMLRMFRREE